MPLERFVRHTLVVIAIVGLAGGLILDASAHVNFAKLLWELATVPVIVALIASSVRDLVAGRIGIDAIALISMIGALTLGQPLAGAVVALMYSGGMVLEEFAVARAEKSLRSLVDRAPRQAHRLSHGKIDDIPIAEVAIGDQILVRAGEVVPVDGTIVGGPAIIDESPLTGEPIPVTRSISASVYSGSINAGHAFEMTATSLAGESTYAGILRLITAAQTARAPFVRLADRFALGFLPLTTAVAVLAWLVSGDAMRSLAVFVAATPCPLILAAPVAFIAGVAQAARRGVLVKGGGALEALAHAHTVLFDKTGTLTLGGARLLSVEVAPGENADDVLGLCASLEQASHHVVAEVIVKAAMERRLRLRAPTDIRETLGSGLHGIIDGRRVSAGSPELIFSGISAEGWASRATRRAAWRSALVIFVAVDSRPIGAILLADELRPETPRAVRLLREAGVKKIMMITGDREAPAQTIGAALDLDGVLAERAPSDKLDAVRVEQRLNRTVMIGDGINDAPALAAADVGIALGARGATASSEAADVVILADRLDRVGEAVSIAQRAHRIALESIVVGMGLSSVAMLAATIGWLGPVPAAIAQEVIDVIVIINALRALRSRQRRIRKPISAELGRGLHDDHIALNRILDQLRTIADALDDADPANAAVLIGEAERLVRHHIVAHERDDEGNVYPKLTKILSDRTGLSAMSRAHREILHLGRLLERLTGELPREVIDHYLIRDAQRIIEAIEQIVRIHSAQEEDIYDAVSTA